MLLPFSAEKLVRQNSFPQTELGAFIGGLISSAMIYLVLKETNQNLKKNCQKKFYFAIFYSTCRVKILQDYFISHHFSQRVQRASPVNVIVYNHRSNVLATCLAQFVFHWVNHTSNKIEKKT